MAAVLGAAAGCESPSRPAKENLAAFEKYTQGLPGVIAVVNALVLEPDKAIAFQSPTDTSATVILDPGADPEVVAATCGALSSWESSARPNHKVQMHVTVKLGALRMDLPNDPSLTAERLRIAEELAADPEIVAVFVEGEDSANTWLTFYLQRSATADAAALAQRWAGPLAEIAPLGILNIDYRDAQRGTDKPEVNQRLSEQAATTQG